MHGYISGNIRKAFFWKNIRIFLILDPESSISGNTRNVFSGWIFFYIFELGLKAGLDSS